MRVLVFNSGSSSLKFALLDAELEAAGTFVARGIVDEIGGRASLRFEAEGSPALKRDEVITDHAQAVGRVLQWLHRVKGSDDRPVEAVGHRVVHGGERFVEPVRITPEVAAAIEKVSELAPLHNAPALAAVRAAQSHLGPDVPMVAVFDTAFHRTLAEPASRYAIPTALAQRHQIRRFGFHGLAHRYMTERYARLTATPLENVRIVTLQLGNGCSAAAISGGRSIDTSMGFTPLEGLIMGTRSGDVDPSLAGFLAHREGVAVEEAEGWLNSASGLLGISGRSRDMRELLRAEAEGDAAAARAIAMFCYRVRKYIGSYLVVLNGAHAIVFGGGIGENAPEVRSRICMGMDWCGLSLDPDRNRSAVGSEARITGEGSRIHAYVIPVREEAVIAADTVRCLGSG